MKECSSCDRYWVESGDSTSILTVIFGLAFMKALIATWVCWPSVPSPDSAKTMVCLALAETGFAGLELEQAASPSASPVTGTTAIKALWRRLLAASRTAAPPSFSGWPAPPVPVYVLPHGTLTKHEPSVRDGRQPAS